MSNAKFTELQQSIGLTHHANGVLLDASLDNVFDPVAVYHHDWMHYLFVDGCFNLSVYLLF